MTISYIKILNFSINFFGFYGAPEGIRTPDPQLRRLLLYPPELQAHMGSLSLAYGYDPSAMNHKPKTGRGERI